MVNEQDKMRDIEQLARLMDTKFEVAGIRFGLDVLLGLIPGVGDSAAALISLYIIMRAREMGASGVVILRMIGNVLLELLVGTVPIVGDVFDVAWRANVRNVKLLRQVVNSPRRATVTSAGVTFLVVAGIILLVGTAVAVPIVVLVVLFEWIGGLI